MTTHATIETVNGFGERFRVTVLLDESKLQDMAIHQANKARGRGGKATAAQGFVVVECQKIGELEP